MIQSEYSSAPGRPVARLHRLSAFGRVHRLLLYSATTVWFMAIVRAFQRNYQDSWILADVAVPFAAWAAVFLWVSARENDNRIVAILSAFTAAVAEWVPGLKYVQPYGNSIDGVVHYLATKTIMDTGHGLPPAQVYASIPGMHAWLAGLALIAGISASAAIKFALPLTGALLPLIVYWLTRRAAVLPQAAKYGILVSCLATFPLFDPTGTGFSLPPLLMTLGALLLREYYAGTARERFTYTLIALGGAVQLVVWHSTTPMILPVILGVASLTPVVVQFARSGRVRLHPETSFIRFGLLAAVMVAAYHVLRQDTVYRVMAGTAARLIAGRTQADGIVPSRAFQISRLDLLRILVLLQGREFLLLCLLGLGALIVWRYRRLWARQLPFYMFWLLVAATFLVLMGSAVTGLDYGRFLVVPVAVAPLFAGPALWWLQRRLAPLDARLPMRAAWMAIVAALAVVWTMEFYNYQPLVPKAKSLDPAAPREYIVWIHTVNTAYQQRMLAFAQNQTAPTARFALDITGDHQFLRYFGFDASVPRGLYLPLQLEVPVESPVRFLLLHWPGASGPYAEQVEWRSQDKISQLRDTPGWSLVYDNGSSFILKVR